MKISRIDIFQLDIPLEKPKRYPNKNIHEVVPSFEDFVEVVLRGKTKEDRHTEPSWFSCNMCQAQYDVIGTLFSKGYQALALVLSFLIFCFRQG